jgi:hypothetical protein
MLKADAEDMTGSEGGTEHARKLNARYTGGNDERPAYLES